ncbi:hypothetical protein TREMEDRAFT_64442 [Tremella mesenterica DSM 1558]|uniref:uncharacterized protein n=1 Tax=Tremella mesenterica (strain ATCC 24925 / CBS 8224 / DSM 1558 / NBRC 9311 / NRRL Y-6157 / RJB 2259-6 / UBC 559-6) TaxID=578456 RepID=UPI0003F499C8|nr:uncharacterized protein TREMEDRAFT_64442 [Tremella mesenterica DSM 1558]EIW67199.1 hypothetical protein TREMEDRAFT_64442 [Tremella mesenterica DSM 1558]
MAKLDGVRLSRDNRSRSTAKLNGVRLSRDNGKRSVAMLGGVSRRRRRMAGDSGKLDERQVSRGSSTVGLLNSSSSTDVTVTTQGEGNREDTFLKKKPTALSKSACSKRLLQACGIRAF